MVDFEIWGSLGKPAEKLIVSDAGDFEIWNSLGRSATQLSTDSSSPSIGGDTQSARTKVIFILRRRR